MVATVWYLSQMEILPYFNWLFDVVSIANFTFNIPYVCNCYEGLTLLNECLFEIWYKTDISCIKGQKWNLLIRLIWLDEKITTSDVGAHWEWYHQLAMILPMLQKSLPSNFFQFWLWPHKQNSLLIFLYPGKDGIEINNHGSHVDFWLKFLNEILVGH